jgi:para-nitrobenzyl esterase
LPREQLVTYADGYFSTLQQNDGTIRGTAFSPEATRIENGLLFPEIEKGFKTGNYRFNERVRDRDYVLIDEERQVVIARGFIDHKGVLDDYVLTDGAPRKSVYREPHSWAFLEMFKVEDRRITAVQAVFLGAPYYMPPPWPTSPIVAQIPPVKVTGGEVSGLYESGLSVFKGIAFAAPPVGALRWKAPAPVAPWTGTRKADSFANACMQAPNTQGNTAPVSEDCLYLNVWTPARTTTAKLPVIVWIHGGGYVGGSTSIPMYDGTALANKGVVVVSVAYRLGVYGFMAHPQLSRESGRGSGAYGILDLVAGLQWVKANAAAFGGDPDNVTIFGHSAGSAAVSLLAASPRSKGLFHRVIAMSGASFGPLQTSAQNGSGLGIPAMAYAESNGKAFLDKLGVKDIAAARRVDAATLQAATAGMTFRPAADGYLINADLRTLYGKGRFNDTPVLLGNVSDETLVFGGPKSVTPADFEKQIRERYPAQADAVLAAYPHATEAEAIKALRHVGNETSFTWNTWAWAREQSRHGKGKVFLYHFNNPVPPAEGSGHGSDVPFAFRTLATRRAPSLQDAALADTISSLYVNFAAKGDPNGPGLPTWAAFTEASPQAMVFDAAPSSRTYPLLQRVKLFDPYFEGRR